MSQVADVRGAGSAEHGPDAVAERDPAVPDFHGEELRHGGVGACLAEGVGDHAEEQTEDRQ